MKKYSFIFDTEVLKLEYKNQWKQAVDFLYHQWIEDPLNINNFLCLGTEIWYALIEMDHTRDLPMNFSNEERVLEELRSEKFLEKKSRKEKLRGNIKSNFVLRIMKQRL